MSRIISSNHKKLFQILGGDDRLAQEEHLHFARWIASHSMNEQLAPLGGEVRLERNQSSASEASGKG